MEFNKKTIRNIFIGVFACIVLYWVLHETDRVKNAYAIVMGMISPFIIGSGIAFIINVPMRAFEGKLQKITKAGLRRCVALLLTFIALLLILALVFWLLIPQMIDTVQSLIPKLQNFAVEAEAAFFAFLEDNPKVMEWVSQNIDLEKFDLDTIIQNLLTFIGNSLSTVVSSTFSAISILGSAIVDFVIALVFSIYCLFQKENLARQGRKLLYAFFPEKFSDRVVRVLRLTNSTFSNFLSGQCVEVCILGCLFAVSMAIFQMPYIPLVSVLVAVTAFIPVVGAWVGCVLGAFFILVANPIQAVWFVIMFVILQQIENNLIYPRVVGTSIGLSGMWVLIAVAVGGELIGVAGMFLMIPFASVLYTLLRQYTNKRLEKKDLDPQKLQEQPPEIRSHFKKNTENGLFKKMFKKKKK